MGYTLKVADIGCFIAVSISTLDGKVQDYLLTTKPIAIRPHVAVQLEAMISSNKPISIPILRPHNAQKGKWTVLVSKQKAKIQLDGKTQVKDNWGDGVKGKVVLAIVFTHFQLTIMTSESLGVQRGTVRLHYVY